MTIMKTFGKGYVLFKGLSLSREVIYDFALNNPIVSQIMTISEIFKIEKIKGGIRFYLLNNIICNAYLTIIDSPTSEEVENFKGIINVGDYIIRVNINATRGKDKSNLKIENSIKLLNQCFMYMLDQQQQEFFDYYIQYLPSIRQIAKVKQIEEETNETLKKKFPEIFVSGYGRQCQNRQPTLISEDEAQQSTEDVMLFPQTPVEGRQGWYVCRTRKTHQYVGYIENTLSNKDSYGFLPCCFKDDQQNDTKEIRYKYENKLIDITGQQISGTIIEEEKITANSIIKTNKILSRGRYGILPPNIISLFTSMDRQVLLGYSRYLRKGMDVSPSSVIECLIDAIGMPNVDIKNQIVSLAKYNLTSQNMLFPNDIIKIINNNEDIDPIHFVSLLENLFRINIIIFCRDKIDNTDGSFSTPIYKKYLIINEKREPYKKTVLLFRTTGSESNRDVLYPQTELIVLEQSFKSLSKVETKNISKNFDTTSSFIQQLFIMYHGTMNIIYENIQFQNKIISQSEDSYGKIRSLTFQMGITVYITPIAALSAKQFERGMAQYSIRQDIKRYSTTIIQHFFNTETQITNQQKVLYTNPNGESLLIGYCFDIANNKGFIYSDSTTNTNEITSSIYSIDYNEYICPLGVNESLLEKYNRFIRLSNMLLSYSYYLFSKKNDKLEQLINVSTTDEFNQSINEYVSQFALQIIVKSNHEYINQTRSLNLKNKSFIQDKEYLIVSSEEIKKRLLYNIYLLLKNDITTMIKYKTKKYVPNYYTTPKDFIQSEHYTIYYTKKEFALYNMNPTLIYKSYNFPPNQYAELFF